MIYAHFRSKQCPCEFTAQNEDVLGERIETYAFLAQLRCTSEIVDSQSFQKLNQIFFLSCMLGHSNWLLIDMYAYISILNISRYSTRVRRSTQVRKLSFLVLCWFFRLVYLSRCTCSPGWSLHKPRSDINRKLVKGYPAGGQVIYLANNTDQRTDPLRDSPPLREPTTLSYFRMRLWEVEVNRASRLVQWCWGRTTRSASKSLKGSSITMVLDISKFIIRSIQKKSLFLASKTKIDT